MPESKNKVYVELYDAPLTKREDDRIGRVLNNGSATVDDLIADAIERGTDLNPVTLRAAYNLLKSAALNRALRAQRVEFGLGITYIESTGSFIGDAAKWDPAKNRLVAKLLPSKELREALKSVEVVVLGMAKIPNMINSVEDVVTGQVNICLTPGGMAHIHGSKIKIAGTSSETGLKLSNPATGDIRIPDTAIGINDPARVSFVVPADLPAIEYTLSIVTQYTGGGRELVQPRTVTLDYPLQVE
ncbi:MAG: DUF4469 domain-containing protein [Tannerella sp.]|jgi:hypothetical protein|nr:DUF4469 domain-containing protein [Tannerella sp.]